MQHKVVTAHRTRHEEATGRRMQVAGATTAPVLRFGVTTAASGPRFAGPTGLIRVVRLGTTTAGRTVATDRHEAAIGLRTPRGVHQGAAVRGRLRLGHAAQGPAGHAGTTIRGRSGIPVTRSRVVAGLSRRELVVAAAHRDQAAGPPSGQDHLGAEVRVANGAELVVGRAVAEDRQHASAHRGRTETQGETRERRAGRRIGAGDQGDRRGAEAGRAGRRATRRDGLVAARDL